MSDVIQILEAMVDGDPKAVEKLMPLVMRSFVAFPIGWFVNQTSESDLALAWNWE
jgi:hypothetical protein